MGRGSFSSDGSSDAGGARLALFSPPPRGNQHWRSGSVTKTYKTDTPDTDTFPSVPSDPSGSEKQSGGARLGGHSRQSSMASAVSMQSSHSRSSSNTYVGNGHEQIQPFANFQPGASHHPSSSRPPQRYQTPENQVTPPNKVQQLAKGLSSMELTRSGDHPAISVSLLSPLSYLEHQLTLSRISENILPTPTVDSVALSTLLTPPTTSLPNSARVLTWISIRFSRT